MTEPKPETPHHVVVLMKPPRAGEGSLYPGERWAIDGEIWWRWAPDVKGYDSWAGRDRQSATAPHGWYRERAWLDTSWHDSAKTFDPLMSAVIQAIWEAHHER